jgi:hypothetical protein
MYDAQQGSTSGAHIDMSTGTGTNNIHGQAYVHRGTNWLNADPYFYNADPNIPRSEKNPSLHRYSAGGTIGLPIKKDKLFFFGSYQHTHASDEEIDISRPTVSPGLTDDRSASALAAVGNSNNLSSILGLPDGTVNSNVGLGPGDINPIAYTFFNYKLPNGQYLIPSANPNAVATNTTNPALIEAFLENAEIPGTAYFIADQAVAFSKTGSIPRRTPTGPSENTPSRPATASNTRRSTSRPTETGPRQLWPQAAIPPRRPTASISVPRGLARW